MTATVVTTSAALTKKKSSYMLATLSINLLDGSNLPRMRNPQSLDLLWLRWQTALRREPSLGNLHCFAGCFMNATPLLVQNFSPVWSVLRTHRWKSWPSPRGQIFCIPGTGECKLSNGTYPAAHRWWQSAVQVHHISPWSWDPNP